MNAIIIPIDVPSELMIALNESEEELKSHFQLTIALNLFRARKLTLGKAIQLSGLAKSKILISGLHSDQIIADVEKLEGL